MKMKAIFKPGVLFTTTILIALSALISLEVISEPVNLESSDLSIPVISNGQIIITDKENYRVQAFDLDGNNITGFPYSLVGINLEHISDPVTADIDNDTTEEILISYIDGGEARLLVLESNGTVKIDTGIGAGYFAYITAPCVIETTGDDTPEIILGTYWGNYTSADITPATTFNPAFFGFNFSSGNLIPLSGNNENCLLLMDTETITKSKLEELLTKNTPALSYFAPVDLPDNLMVTNTSGCGSEVSTLEEGLFFHLNFNNALNLGYDSQNWNHFENINAVNAIPGMSGLDQAANFDSSKKSYLQISPTPGHLIAPDEYTIAAWVYVKDDKQGNIIVIRTNTTYCDYALYTGKYNNKLTTWNGMNQYTSNNSVNFDEWTHVAVTGKRKPDTTLYTITFYINGKQDKVIEDLYFVSPAPASIPILVGYNGVPSGQYMAYADINLDDLVMYNRVLSEYEMKQLSGTISSESLHPALTKGFYTTLYTESESKLIGLAPYEISLDNGSVVKTGLGIIDAPISGNKLGNPATYQNSVIVLDSEDTGDSISKLISYIITPTESGHELTTGEYELTSGNATKSGTITGITGEENILVAPWQITNGGTNKVFSLLLDADSLLAETFTGQLATVLNNTVEWPEPFDSTYLKIAAASLTLDETTSNWYIFGNQYIDPANEQEETIPFAAAVGSEYCRGIAVADSNSDGFKEVACTTNLGNLYIFTPEILEPPQIAGALIEATYELPEYGLPEADYTNLADVHINLYLSNAPKKVMVLVSEDPSFEDTEPVVYQLDTPIDFSLTAGFEEKTIYIKAYNNGGEATTSKTVTYDGAAPNAVLAGYEETGITNNNKVVFTIILNVPEPNLHSVWINEQKTLHQTEGDTISIDYTLEEGENDINSIKLFDKAGNNTEILSEELNYQLDTQAPVVEITSSTVSSVPEYTLTGTVTDPHFETLTINGQAAAVDPASGEFNQELTLDSEGDNTITIEATDTAGNTHNGSFTVTYTPLAPPQNASITIIPTQESIPGLSLPVTGHTNKKAVKLHLHADNATHYFFSENADSLNAPHPWTPLTSADAVLDHNFYSVGPHTIYAVFKNEAEKTAEAEASITIDLWPPYGFLYSYTAHGLRKDPNIFFKISYSSAAKIEDVHIVAINDQSVDYQKDGNNVVINLTLAEGVNTISSIKMYDKAGNSAIALSNPKVYTLDTLPPQIEIISAETSNNSEYLLTGKIIDANPKYLNINGLNYTAADPETGNFSKTITLNNIGDNEVEITAYDKVGYKAELSFTVSFEPLYPPLTEASIALEPQYYTEYPELTKNQWVKVTSNITAEGGETAEPSLLQIMISGDISFDNASWGDYSPSINYPLPAGDGLKTIYAKFKYTKDPDHEFVLATDTITLDTKDAYIIDSGPEVVSLNGSSSYHFVAMPHESEFAFTIKYDEPVKSFGFTDAPDGVEATISEVELPADEFQVNLSNLIPDELNEVTIQDQDLAGNYSNKHFYIHYKPDFPVNASITIYSSTDANWGYTNTTLVNLDLTITGENMKMYLSEDPAFADAIEKDYDPEPIFPLSNEDGEKTVYVKFKNNHGEVIKSASITLDTTEPVIEITSPADGYLEKEAKSNVQIHCSFSENNLRQIKYQNSSGAWLTKYPTPSGSSGEFYFIFTPEEGENNITIKAIDKANNVTEDEITFIYEPLTDLYFLSGSVSYSYPRISRRIPLCPQPRSDSRRDRRDRPADYRADSRYTDPDCETQNNFVEPVGHLITVVIKNSLDAATPAGLEIPVKCYFKIGSGWFGGKEYYFGTKYISDLEPGETKTLSWFMPIELSGQANSFTVKIDPGNILEEKNEYNNSKKIYK